jgi:proline dehydrogenase
VGVMRSLLLKGSESPWLATHVANRRFAQRAVRRFMPGETVDAALAAAEELRGRGITAVLTQLGEAVSERGEAEAVTAHYLNVLDRVQRTEVPAQLSVKPTQLGLDLGVEICMAQAKRLVDRAAQVGTFVWIDMEASPYVDATLDLYRALRAEQQNVGVCLQAYLYRTAADLESLLPIHASIRLVKGAYSELPGVAFVRKADVDENFMKLAKRLLSGSGREGGVRHGFGTHDMQLVARIRDFAEGAGITKDAYEIQMLYGIRRNDQVRLSAEGASVRVLISYGSAWFPWYMRRLAERPANLGFVLRSVFTS